MGSLSPLQIALLIVAAVAVVGIVITAVRSRLTYSGYDEIAGEVARLGHAMHGEIFRDGADVVVSGSYEKYPAVVRFSNEENTPGLNIRMQAPATFLLSVVPAGTQTTEGGRILVRTTDELFDSRFNTRTDQPTQAKMFLTNQATALLQRLACSKSTYISVGNGVIELSELEIPPLRPQQHIVEHLKAMVKLSESLRTMPGADRVKLVTFARERHVAARVAIIVGALVALASIFAAMKVPSKPATVGVNAGLTSGILPLDASRIPNVDKWRAATADDMAPAGVSWLRGNGQQPKGRIEGDFAGNGATRDVAYLLVGPDGTRRLVILADNQNRYDTRFPNIWLLARVPKSQVDSIQWQGRKPDDVAGDGVLILRAQDDPASGLVIFLNGRGGIVSGSPVNYQAISLE